ncbi:receptor-like protein EIX2 [Bidens hawaiensis]|uniref:receptor-like protein EIX2 n=1 Tax=Bidens hawaiensis TaxID=980011 RepID=UPI00404B3248
MGNQWGLGIHFIFVTIFLVAVANTGLGAQNVTVACIEHERLALLKFKHSVIDDNNMLSSWVENDCCQWERVTCDGVTGSVKSLHLGAVIGLSSYEYLVSKELDTSLGGLRRLKYLDLSGNDFQGSRIPRFIGSLKQLAYLNLSNAYFSGIIPHHLGNLSNLKFLDLSSSSKGNPHELMADDLSWISGLSSLEHLDMSTVKLSRAKNLDMVLYMTPSLKALSLSFCDLSNANLGHVHNLSTSLSNIKYLDLSINSFKGQLPQFFQNMTSLQFLDLSSFAFSPAWNFANYISTVPSLLELLLSDCKIKETHLSHTINNFTTLSNIQYLDLSDNELTGPIPTFPGKLIELSLKFNNLSGSIPNSLGNLRLLQILDLSGNKLTGPIPAFLGKLTELYLSFNYLNGSIPESFGRLAALTRLFLGYNDLSGTIPVSIGQLSKLHSLDVSYNSLEGVVSEAHFDKLSMLKYFIIASNHNLTFDVSYEWQPPFQLIILDLSSCKIAKGFPQWLRNQRKLYQLELSNVTISGPLPTWFRNLPIIPFINLSHNNLSGPLTNLPSGDAGDTYIDDDSVIEITEPGLYVQNNIFSESIPRSLCKRIDILILDLSGNRLTGEIPQCFKNLQQLQFMRLSSNKLSGGIPSFIGNFLSLSSLNLNENNFSGELPTEIWNLNGLKVLDLGDNTFCGKLPEWIGEKIKSLHLFRLHNNNFGGGIPRSLCKNVGLQILDVARNNLTGTIPHCLGELRGMANLKSNVIPDFVDREERVIQVLKGIDLEYTKTWYFVKNMDLSSNNLVGEIPVELTALRALVGLNLSNNHLSGGIPKSIGNITALNSLDLSRNKLSGLIPPSIAALTFLSHLNLSNNNFSGRIPTGNQLQTLVDPSIYAGNKGLCGAPLPKNCSNHEGPLPSSKNKYEVDHEPNKVLVYLDIACGFGTGFWVVIVVLLLKKQWRHTLFVFSQETMDKLHVVVMVRINKMKRGREAT